MRSVVPAFCCAPVGSGRPLVFAHRGGAALRPENTLEAFRHSLALGADGLELDVRLSKDGRVVVHHDATLDRTTSGRGPVAAMNAAELVRLDAAYGFGREQGYPFRNRGITVPLLREVLHACPEVPIIIELKGPGRPLAEAVVDELRTAGAVERVCVGAADHRVLRYVRRLEPALATSAGREEVRWALYRSWMGCPPSAAAGYRAFQVPEVSGIWRVVSPRFVRLAHASGRAVQVWTVDRPEDMRRLVGWGADAIISDRPDLGVDVVRRL